ncbi:MAG TPA: response regulator [Gemmatimonadaceae bacterium]|nr:response regulator [Gemmatimonadaceae bacterium]
MIRFDRREDDAERDERFQQLVELAPDGILIHDGERISTANAAAARLAGANSVDDLIGKPIDLFLNPPYLKAVEEMLKQSPDQRRTHASGADAPFRDTFRRLDGSTVEVEIRAALFMERGRPAAHLVIRDITGRLAVEEAERQVAERLQQAQKMEAVGALAGGVAHEVNNMMSVILGSSEFLLEDTQTSERHRADVHEIMNAAERASAVTRQLLAFSRHAAHRPQDVDLATTVRAAGSVVRRLLGETRRLELDPKVMPRVFVDPGQLAQVIVNLALNARDAMPDGGVLTIATGLVDLPGDRREEAYEGLAPGRYATLTMRDTGGGMDDATLAHIFEPFFTTKPLGQGTGLGLAAVHGIVAQNGGCVTVETKPGMGTTFTVLLPLAAVGESGHRTAEPAPPAETATHQDAVVLVVDDEPAVRAVAARILERAGFDVRQSSGGIDALAETDRLGPPDVVLTDLMMPGGGGLELARSLRERWPSLPIVFMSGYSAEYLGRDGAMGADDVLISKPFSPDELVGHINRALASNQTQLAVSG